MYWEFWMGGLALACIAVFHWLLVGRMMAVSGRFTTLVNRLRFGATEPQPDLSPDELMAAMQAATLEEFGEEAAANEPVSAPAAMAPASRPPQTPAAHVVFLLSLAAGGLIASLGAGGWHASSELRGDLFAGFFGAGPATTAAVLIFGGMLVGFGTRMAAGCTSGHGLCGVSRFQIGSLVATASFFGAGIVVSVLLEVMT